MNRRDFVKKASIAGIAGAGVIQSLDKLTVAAAGQSELIIAQGGEPSTLLQAALKTYGGLGKIVKPGSVVSIKANFSWNRKPEQAACNNPDFLAALVKECKKAGAKKVRVIDLSIDYAMMSMETSGIKKAVEAVGGEVVNLDRAKTVFANSGILKKFSVYEEALKADCLINVPILKSHFVTQMTCALKNYMGLTPDRDLMHSLGTDQAIVDLAKLIKPHLHIVDAYRILKTNGPQGPGEVATLKQLIITHDPVAADAYGASLLGVKPVFLKLAADNGLGCADLTKVKMTRVKC